MIDQYIVVAKALVDQYIVVAKALVDQYIVVAKALVDQYIVAAKALVVSYSVVAKALVSVGHCANNMYNQTKSVLLIYYLGYLECAVGTHSSN